MEKFLCYRIKQLFRTADLMYSIPLHRATIYIFGIFTGYAMRMYNNVRLTKVSGKILWFFRGGFSFIVFFNIQSQLIYGWSGSILLLTIALVGPAKMGNMNYKYNPYDAAIYAAFSPMSWCTIFAWIIYTTHIGHKSKNSSLEHIDFWIFFTLPESVLCFSFFSINPF